MKSFKHEEKIIKKNNENKLISAPNDHQTTILACFHFIIDTIWHKSFRLVVVYEITSFAYSRLLMKAL